MMKVDIYGKNDIFFFFYFLPFFKNVSFVKSLHDIVSNVFLCFYIGGGLSLEHP